MRHGLKTYLPAVVISLVIGATLWSPFIPFAVNDNYFRLYPLSISVLLLCLTSLLLVLLSKVAKFHFILADGLVFACTLYVLLRYDYSQHLADWSIINVVLLLLLWFTSRIIFSFQPIIVKTLLPLVIALMGCLLPIWGMLQLYGWAKPEHLLFHITGPFFNPGPYSGYLALLFPVCLYGFFQSTGWIKRLFTLSFLLMICVLPAAMSRSAWIAIAICLIWVMFMTKNWKVSLQSYYRKSRIKILVIAIIGMLLIVAAGIFLYQLKADSVRGRLFIWKNCFYAITEEPFIGHGIGRFPAVYGKAQADYFTAGQASLSEERVAGYVEYAFNDYLQLTLEGGLILLALTLAWGISVFRCGLSKQRYGYCGALLAFAIFALSSYPLQVLPFGVIVVVLGAACSTTRICGYKSSRNYTLALAVLLCIIAVIGVWKLSKLPLIYKQWEYAEKFSNEKGYYDITLQNYQKIYPYLQSNYLFLMEYARFLGDNAHLEEACEVLNHAKLISNNSKIWLLQGIYYEMANKYVLAESCYKYASKILPMRLTPYYMLAKLYCNPRFLNKKKAEEMANIVLTKDIKINSQRTDNMREEMRTLINKLNTNN